jgi:hypothetical protein
LLQLSAVRERFGDEGLIALPAVVRAAQPSDHAPRIIELGTLLPRLSRRAAVFIGDLLKPREPHGKRVLTDYPRELQVLFSVMARHSSPRHASMAYEAGARTAGALPGCYQELSDWIPPLDAALAKLEHLQPVELLGLTATPERMDGEDITRWFGDRTAVELRLWEAIDDGYHRLLLPSITTDVRGVLKDRADAEAARVFGEIRGQRRRCRLQRASCGRQ